MAKETYELLLGALQRALQNVTFCEELCECHMMEGGEAVQR